MRHFSVFILILTVKYHNNSSIWILIHNLKENITLKVVIYKWFQTYTIFMDLVFQVGVVLLLTTHLLLTTGVNLHF